VACCTEEFILTVDFFYQERLHCGMFDFGLIDGQEDRRNYSSSSMSELLFIYGQDCEGVCSKLTSPLGAPLRDARKSFEERQRSSG
jgi:hypothetical protein